MNAPKKLGRKKLTPWFRASVMPRRNGLYEVRRRVAQGWPSRSFLVFDGGQWRHTEHSSSGLFPGRRASMVDMDGDVWRGLAEKP